MFIKKLSAVISLQPGKNPHYAIIRCHQIVKHWSYNPKKQTYTPNWGCGTQNAWGGGANVTRHRYTLSMLPSNACVMLKNDDKWCDVVSCD